MSALAAVIRHPWQRRRQGHGVRATAIGLAFVLLPLTAFAVWRELPLTVWLGLTGLVLLTVLWWSTVEGLVLQNRPDLARLLPGQLRVLRGTLLAHALVFVLAGTGCVALLLGLRPAWPWMVAVTMLLMAWLVRSAWLWLPLSLAPLSVPWLPVGPLTWAGWVTASPWSVQAALAGALLLMLMLVLGDGGAAHRKSYERQRRWALLTRAQSEGRPVSAVSLGPVMRGLARCFTWPLAMHRRWLLRRPAPDNALTRLDLGLLAGGQWPMLAWLMLLIVGGGMGAVMMLVMWASPDTDLVRIVDAARIGLCAGAFNLLCTPLLQRPAALCSRRREQALLVLLPGVPVGAELAARLEARWRREHLAMWALVSAPVLLVAAQGSPGTLSFAAAFSACCLPLVWLSQWRHRRARGTATGFALWMAAPSLGILPAALAESALVPAWASLATGVLVYALCAWRSTPPRRGLLPTPG
ncbi:MAG: hypothetical protein JNM33_06820 [Rubrivivax sp.]|nr:hypothetical protein [Rubrivivax sp.]